MTYSQLIEELLAYPASHALDAGESNTDAVAKLETIKAEDLFDAEVKDIDMAEACLAGLWLYYDEIERSHTISQGINTSTGSFWHMIMHRRENDFGNARYWLRQKGLHPIEAVIAEAAQGTVNQAGALFPDGKFSNAGFISAVEAVLGTDPAGEVICRELQAIEWQCLFEYCYKRALAIN